ncbi:MAG TPA: L,D-transpeptidase family protein [Pelomicrobium sp.]|nr:L,D-transpeptidase family protein [Pelomicrobium sp.]
MTSNPMFSFVARAVLLAAVSAWAASAAAASAVEPLRVAVERLRAGDVNVAGERIAARTLVAQFYENRGFVPAWGDPAKVRELLALVQASPDHGLDPIDYHAAAVAKFAAPPPADGASVAVRELLLTDALVRLAYHLRFGKVNPKELDPDWNFSRTLRGIDPVSALEAALATPDLTSAVLAYAPRLPSYGALMDALARYRDIAARGGWPPVPAGMNLEAGVRDARVAALRARLAAAGDLPAADAEDPELFDAEVDAGVRRFQHRHGLAEDGVVGPKTLAELNVPVAARIDQIRVNLERTRWVARDLVGDFLIVDIAGFRAELHLEGLPVWRSRVVVGRPYRETPVFRAEMEYLVINPSWTVPPTILKEDVLPKLAKDPGYLARENMTVVDNAGRAVDAGAIDWKRYARGGFPYQIVQLPGEKNPLGRIKFMFPNAHFVYLHDTPSRSLFERAERAFSSGCIRVEAPVELAVLLLGDPVRWSPDAVRAVIESGETRTVPVGRKVPVLLLYWTAEVDAGIVHFRRDLYGRDQAVLKGLQGPVRLARPAP